MQRQVETQLGLVRAQSALLAAQLQQDHTEIARVDVALMILAETCNVAKVQAETTATQVQQALDEAQATRTHWETVLTQARARFAQAEQALAEAQREMQQAQTEVVAAQAALGRLAGTANEKEARVHLHDTQTWMQRAEREQGHAERELEQAQTRITACTNAIRLCETEGDPYHKGGTTISDQAQILCNFGVPTHDEARGNVAGLATKFEQGRGIIIGVNAGVLWNNMNYYGSGGSNHAVVVTGVVRDATGGAILGFYVNDSGSKDEHGRAKSCHFVSINTMRLAWEKVGGTFVVTDRTHRW